MIFAFWQCRGGYGAVTFLAAKPFPSEKTAIKTVPISQQVGSVGDEHGDLPGLSEQFCQDGLVFGKRRPTPERKGQPSGHHIDSRWNRGEGGVVGPVEDQAAFAEGIQVGRLDPLISVTAQMVVAQGIPNISPVSAERM